MTDPSASSVVNSLLEEFGDNAPFVLELYARYRLAPASEEENWKRTFQGLEEPAPSPGSGSRAPGGSRRPSRRARRRNRGRRRDDRSKHGGVARRPDRHHE